MEYELSLFSEIQKEYAIVSPKLGKLTSKAKTVNAGKYYEFKKSLEDNLKRVTQEGVKNSMRSVDQFPQSALKTSQKVLKTNKAAFGGIGIIR